LDSRHWYSSAGVVGISMSAMKRPAARMSRGGAAGEPVLKKPTGGSSRGKHINQLCNKVAKAISSSPEYPDQVKSMLSNMVNGTLAVPKEKRHAFQDEAIDMVRAVLDSLKAAAQSKVTEAEQKLETTFKESRERDNLVEAARAKQHETTITGDAAKVAVNEHTSARVAAKQALTSAEQEQTGGDAGLVVTEDKKKKLESGLELCFGPLKNGETPAAQVQDGIKKVQKLAKDLGFDMSLVQTVPAALAKAPGERSSFNNVVIEQIETEFNKCMATFTEELANAEPAKKERADKVEAASNEHAQALASEEAAKNAKVAANAAQKEAAAELQAQLKAQQQDASEVAAASAGVDAAKAELTEFDEGPLAAFQELLELTEIPPPAPVPAPEEESATAAPEEATDPIVSGD